VSGAAVSVRALVFDFGGVIIDWNPRYLYRTIFSDESAVERFLEEIDFAVRVAIRAARGARRARSAARPIIVTVPGGEARRPTTSRR
jgi:hypothetical protein